MYGMIHFSDHYTFILDCDAHILAGYLSVPHKSTTGIEIVGLVHMVAYILHTAKYLKWFEHTCTCSKRD